MRALMSCFLLFLDHGAAANIGWDNDDWGEPSNAANWFDNVGQVQQDVNVQAPPEQEVDINEIQRSLESKQAECVALRTEVDTLANIRETLQSKIEELNQIIESHAENDTKIEAIGNQVEELAAKLRESENLVVSMQAAESSKNQEVAKLKQELEAHSSQQTSTVQSSIPETNFGWSNDDWGEPSSASSFFENLGQAQSEQSAEKDSTEIQKTLEAKEVEVRSLTNANEELQTKIFELNQIIENQNTDNNLRIESLGQVETLRTKLRESEDLLVNMQTTEYNMNQEIIRLKQELESQKSSSMIPETGQDSITTADTNFAWGNDTWGEPSSASSFFENLGQPQPQQSAEKDSTELQKALEAKQEDVHSLQLQIVELNQIIENQNSENNMKIVAFVSQVQELTARLRESENQLLNMQTAESNMNQEIARLKQELESQKLQHTLPTMTAETAPDSSTTAVWGNDTWTESSSASNWFDNIGQTEPEKTALTDTTEIQKALDAKQAECLALASEVEGLVNVREALETKIGQLNQIIESQNNDTRIEALGSQVEQLAAKLGESENLVITMQDAESSMNQEIVKLKQELESQKSLQTSTVQDSNPETNFGWGNNDNWGESSSASSFFENLGQAQLEKNSEKDTTELEVKEAEIQSLVKAKEELEAKIVELNQVIENQNTDNSMKITSIGQQVEELTSKLRESENLVVTMKAAESSLNLEMDRLKQDIESQKSQQTSNVQGSNPETNFGWGNDTWGESSSASSFFENLSQVQPEKSVENDTTVAQKALEAKEAEIHSLVNAKEELQSKIVELNQIIESQNNDTKIEALGQQIEEITVKLRESENLVVNLQNIESNLNQEIARLNGELESQKSHQTLSFKEESTESYFSQQTRYVCADVNE